MDPNPSLVPSSSLASHVLFRVFKAMRCGVVLLDQHKRVVHINSLAERCLRDGLILRGGCLCAVDRVCDVALQATLDRHLASVAKVASGSRGQRDALGLKRRERRPLIVRVVQVEPEARSSFENASLLLIVVDPEDCPEPSDGMLQQVFGLTKSEAKVAFIGMTLEATPSVVTPAGVAGLSFRDEADTANALIPKLKAEGVDAIVEAQQRVAMNYFEDGSVEAACPPSTVPTFS